MTQRFQFSLILLVFFMSAAALLFGWVYFDSVEKKYTELLRIPKDQSVGSLLSTIDEDKKRIAILEAQVKALQDNVIDLAKIQATIPLASVQTEPSPIMTSTEKVDLFIDQKCLADRERLDECVILAEAEVKTGVHVIVKPAKPLTQELNTLAIEFYDRQGKITDFVFESTSLFDSETPIATIVFLNRSDITLQYRPAGNTSPDVVNWDGSGWIAYQRSISQADTNQ